jgi:hypothetical protein
MMFRPGIATQTVAAPYPRGVQFIAVKGEHGSAGGDGNVLNGRRGVFGTTAYFARAGEPKEPGDLAAHEAVIYDQKEESGRGGAVWHFSRNGEEVVVTLKGRLRVSAAEGVRAAVLAGAGIAVGTEWMFTPEVADGTVKEVLRDWELPASAIWAIFPAGRAASTKARAFVSFVREVMSPQSTAVAGSKRFAAGNSAPTPHPKHRSLRLDV